MCSSHSLKSARNCARSLPICGWHTFSVAFDTLVVCSMNERVRAHVRLLIHSYKHAVPLVWNIFFVFFFLCARATNSKSAKNFSAWIAFYTFAYIYNSQFPKCYRCQLLLLLLLVVCAIDIVSVFVSSPRVRTTFQQIITGFVCAVTVVAATARDWVYCFCVLTMRDWAANILCMASFFDLFF